MKHFYLFTFFLCLLGTARAQITLQAENTPQIGDQYVIGTDTMVSAYSIGDAGPNQVWDFTGIMPANFNVVNVVAPGQAQGASAFPEATFALDTDTVFFAQRTDNAVFYLGLAGDFLGTGETLTAKYDRPLKYLEIPTTTQTKFSATATLRAQVFYPALNDSARVIRKETTIAEVDGFGTLLTPNGAFNTLRQRRVSIISDTIQARVFGNWAQLRATLDTIVYYDWLAREAKGVLLSVEMSDAGKPKVVNFTNNVVPAVIAPTANFNFSPRSDAMFQFNDRSANKPDSWQWDFGDGATSSEQNPRHTYPGPGDYTACLIASNEEGIDTICKTVTVEPPPVADFQITANGNGSYNFTDQSTNNPYARRWDFGDGRSSTQRNPGHVYTSPGEYTICLIATNTGGRDTICQNITVVLIPGAAFKIEAQSQDAYNFTDQSTNEPTSWEWDFGDGATSADQNPAHTYAAPGTYTVCLKAGNSEGSTRVCRELKVVFLPEAAFEIAPKGDGLYNFTDKSTNTPTTWKWDFGDGKTSNARNPAHTYQTPGEYTICLTASNSAGSAMVCQQITVVLIPDAGFKTELQTQDTYTFTDESTNEPTAWEWDFGDGAGSTDQSPAHTYAAPGTYTVCLKVSNSEGSTTLCRELAVVFVPEAAFEIEPKGDGVYTFNDISNYTPTEWAWTFGDNGSSQTQNPQHTYTQPGNYTVCLLARNAAGSDTACKNLTVVLIPDTDFNVQKRSENTYDFTDRTDHAPETWTWDFGDGAASTDRNPRHVYAEPGEYTVCLITANSEGADTLCQLLSVVFRPIAGFTYKNEGGGAVSFTDTSRYNPTSWQWDFGDNNTSTEQNPKHTYAEYGNYTVCLVAENSAGFRLKCTEILVEASSVRDLSAELGLRVYPNPADDQFDVKMELYRGAPLRLDVSNAFGQIVYRSEIQTQQTVSTTQWPQGVYFYRLRTPAGDTVAFGRVAVSRR